MFVFEFSIFIALLCLVFNIGLFCFEDEGLRLVEWFSEVIVS